MSHVFIEAVHSHAPGRFSAPGLAVIHARLLRLGEPLPDPKLIASQWRELTIDEAKAEFPETCPELTRAIAEAPTRLARLTAAAQALEAIGMAAPVPETETIVVAHRDSENGRSTAGSTH